MSAPEDPQAFPHLAPHDPSLSYIACGMTLRDWFAGQVLASAAALPFGEGDCLYRAKVAYEQANAMLAEREKSA